MNEFKCKACLIDSTHGKLQKKKEVLLEFTFADASLCLTVSAQNLNLTAYTLNKESIGSILPANDLLVINFKMKSQIKISAMDKTKMLEFKSILDALLRDERDVYRSLVSKFCQKTSKFHSNISVEKAIPKIDEEQPMINDENFKPMKLKTPETTRKKTLTNTSNFYSNGPLVENAEPTSSSEIRINENGQKTSPYFFQRTENKLKRNFFSTEIRSGSSISFLSKIPTTKTRLWENDDDDDWKQMPSKTLNIRKKGLKNIGATCYMNSILQCLLNIDPFRYDLMVTNVDLISSTLLEEETIYLCVLQILALLQDRQTFQSQSQSTTQLTDDERMVESQALSNLKQAVEKHSGHFFGSRQQDSHEFLSLLLSLITDEIEAIRNQIVNSPTLNPSAVVDPIKDNFQFSLATKRRCQICQTSTLTREIHTALLIHVTEDELRTSKTSSFKDLLENYFAPETMDGCFCDDCQTNQRKSIEYQLEQLPRVFIFYIKRWHITKNDHGELTSVSKEDHPIDYSMEIDLSPFCSSETIQPSIVDPIDDRTSFKEMLRQRTSKFEPTEAKRPRIESNEKPSTIDIKPVATGQQANYRLCAVINHHGGSSDVGHYTSTVYDAKTETWWTYDDTSVTSSTESSVLKNLAPDAYGVMYIHKDVLRSFQSV